MRLFKRRSSDPNPQLVSLAPLSPDSEEEWRPSSGHVSPANSTPISGSPKTNRRGLATWGKKVGRKWEQLKRSDSTEILETSPRKYVSSNQRVKSTTPPVTTQKNRKISRVESLRHMFARSNGPQTPSKQAVYSSECKSEVNASKNGSDWVKNECQKGIADLYQLNSLLFKGKEKKCDKVPKSSTQTLKFKKNVIETVMENPLEENGGEGSGAKELQKCEGNMKCWSHEDLLANVKQRYLNKSTSLSFDYLGNSGDTSSVDNLNTFGGEESSKDTYQPLENQNSKGAGLGRNISNGRIQNENIRREVFDGNANVPVNVRTQPHLKEIYNFLNSIIMVKPEDSGNQFKSLLTNKTSDVGRTKEKSFSYSLSSPPAQFQPQSSLTNRKLFTKSMSQPNNPIKTKPSLSLDKIGAARNEKNTLPGSKSLSQTNVKKEIRAETDQTYLSKDTHCSQTSFNRYSSLEKEFKRICIAKNKSDELGLYVEKMESGPGRGCYIISNIEPGGLTDRDGRVREGDEIIKVNGIRLRGLTIHEVRKLMRNSSNDIEIVICRPTENLLLKSSDINHKTTNTSSSGLSERLTGRSPLLPATTEPHEVTSSSYSQPKPQTIGSKMGKPPIPEEKKDSETSRTGMRKFSSHNESYFRNRNDLTDRVVHPNRPKSLTLSIFTVTFHKGPGFKSLGFSIVGGHDSPKGNLGIFIKTVFKTGQAAENGFLREGDEIIAVNGAILQGLTHSEAISVFKDIRSGPVMLHIGRRDTLPTRSNKSKSCDNLDKCNEPFFNE